MEQSNDTFFHREKNSQCLLARSSTFDMRPEACHWLSSSRYSHDWRTQILGWLVKTRTSVIGAFGGGVGSAPVHPLVNKVAVSALSARFVWHICSIKIQVVKNIVSRLRGLEPMNILVQTCAGHLEKKLNKIYCGVPPLPVS